MGTMKDIRAANPNASRDPFPCFDNTDESAMTKALDDRQAFRETFREFADLLLKKDAAVMEKNES